MILDDRADHYAELFTASQTAGAGTTQALVDGVVGLLAQQGVSSAERWPMAMVYLADVIAARARGVVVPGRLYGARRRLLPRDALRPDARRQPPDRRRGVSARPPRPRLPFGC